MSRPTVLLDVPIRYDVGDTVTHAPTVDARVAGVATRLILDTGSSDHVFTIELARAAGLPHVPGDPGTDHAGSSVESWLVGDVSIEIAGAPFALRDSVAITGPAPFEGWGVGGFLSPQHLHPTANVVIDLVADRLLLVGAREDVIDVVPWLRTRAPDLMSLELARDEFEATPVVLASIEPFAPVAAMLNTGGRATEFATAAVPGVVGTVSPDLGKGVSGDPVIGSIVEDRVLRVGGARLPIPRLLVRDAIDSMQGLIGMDALRGTILMVGADRQRPIWWLVPDTRAG